MKRGWMGDCGGSSDPVDGPDEEKAMSFDQSPADKAEHYECPAESCGGSITKSASGRWECDKCPWSPDDHKFHIDGRGVTCTIHNRPSKECFKRAPANG